MPAPHLKLPSSYCGPYPALQHPSPSPSPAPIVGPTQHSSTHPPLAPHPDVSRQSLCLSHIYTGGGICHAQGIHSPLCIHLTTHLRPPPTSALHACPPWAPVSLPPLCLGGSVSLIHMSLLPCSLSPAPSALLLLPCFFSPTPGPAYAPLAPPVAPSRCPLPMPPWPHVDPHGVHIHRGGYMPCTGPHVDPHGVQVHRDVQNVSTGAGEAQIWPFARRRPWGEPRATMPPP